MSDKEKFEDMVDRFVDAVVDGREKEASVVREEAVARFGDSFVEAVERVMSVY